MKTDSAYFETFSDDSFDTIIQAGDLPEEDMLWTGLDSWLGNWEVGAE